MKNIKKPILSLLLILGGILIPSTVLAKNEEFSLIATDFDISANDWEGAGTGDEIASGGNVQPGQVIQVDVYFSPGDVGNLGFNYTINYDNTLFEPIYLDGVLYVDDHSDSTNLYNGGVWPAKGTSAINKKKTDWSTTPNDTGSQLIFVVSDSQQNADNPFVDEGIVATFWLKVKDNVSSGATLNLEFENTAAGMSVDRIDKQKETITTQGISFAVKGNMSSDVTLKTLSAIGNNSLNYIFDPAFVAGSASRTFSTVVPASVASITLNAEATDEKAKVLPGGLGSKNLSVGDNSFNIVVQSEDGKQEIYTINIKRLSNDITLNSLAFSGLTLDYPLSSSTFTYSATAPYKTTSTNVTATATHAKASITQGTGVWNLTNYGSTVNTKTLTVEAEDCKSTYAGVPGNSCTSKDYTLNITRSAPSTNNDLASLKVDNVSVPDFSANKTEYVLTNVANDKTSINISATLSDNKATISGTGSKNLKVGDNEFIVVVTAEDNSTKEYKIKVRRLSNNANLATLNVTSNPQGTLTPNFTPTFYNYYTYTFDSKVTSINISATLEDGNASIVSGTGSYSSSDTEANIVTTAEDGTTKTYIIKFSRNKSSDNNLKSLSIDGYPLNETFSPSTTLYTATIPGTVDTITVKAEANDTNATVSGTGSQSLNYGPNTIQVRVKAENGATKDYTITVTRSKKDISLLSDLKIDGTTIADFNENTLAYTLDVPFEKTSINVNGIAKDSDATVSGNGNITLNTGKNTIPITVTAQDGTTKTTYTIDVNRAKSSNTNLSNLTLAEKSFTFNKATKIYNVDVDYEVTTATITATPEYKDATASVSGPSSLGVGLNTYTITVTAENGDIDTYTLNINRQKSTNVSLNNLTVTNNGTNYLGVFSNSTETYNITVDNSVTNVDINATLADSINQTVFGTGNKTLNTGLNTFEVEVVASSGDKKKFTINITRNLNANNDLASLEVVDHTLSPSFNAATTSYSLTVEPNISSIVINASAQEATSSVSGTGPKTLTTGVNTFNIDVTSENNQTKTYVIVVTKKASNDSSLASLSINEASLNEVFNKGTFNYTATVANNISQITINATASSASAKSVTGTGVVNLQTGPNTIQVVVTAEDNTTSTYEIVVTRAKSSNAYLTSIALSNGYNFKETFNKETLAYSATVENSTSKIKITTVKEDAKATVTGDGEVTLNTGTNTIPITVTAEDGTTTKIYTLTIERKKSSNAYLSGLTSTDGAITPAFNKTEKNYALSVPYEVENASVSATTEDAKATAVINGNTNLSVGTNNATITVTAEDGTIETYNLIITRQKSSNNYLSNLEVIDKNSTNYITVFNKTTLTYNINVTNDIDEIDINATAENSDTTIQGTGKKTLTTGTNNFVVKAISGDGTPREYIINIDRAKNSNADLSSLSVDGQKLVPDFDPATISYSLSVDNSVEKVNITASAASSEATVSGLGEKSLTTGLNTFNIEVTAEDSTTKTYVIVINKAASSNNYLASLLSSEPLNETFAKETLAYSATVANNVDSINFQAVAEDPSATVAGDGTYNLTVGHNNIDITVTAENNTFRIYSIDVYREPSTNNYLSDLKVNGVTINGFERSKTKYTMVVENNITQADVQATLEDSTASVSGTGITYLVTTSLNTINVAVTAQNGDIKTYTIEITRKKSSNNNLALISTTEGTLSPTFDKDTTKYTMQVPYEITSLNLTTVLEDANASLEIEGNVDFQIGSNNIVTIAVKAEDGSTKTYQIEVTRQKQANNFLTDLTVTSSSGKTYNLDSAFNKNILNYTVTIEEEDSNLIIGGTQESLSSSVSGFGNVLVTSFPYIHQVIVTSAGGVDRTYTLTIERKKSSNVDLKGINISEGTLKPAFDKDTTNYSIDVSSTTESIDIEAILNKGQTVAGGGKINLNYGDNNVALVVTAEDGSTKTYNIKINRDQSTPETLSDINVVNGTLSPVFKSEVTDYIAYIGQDATSVTITPTLSDPRSVLSISLNDNAYQNINSIEVTDLEIANTVKIKVEGTNNSTIYTVAIMKQSNEKITSTTYGHDISDGMIKTVKINTSADALKDQLDNDNAKLKIYKSDGVTEYTGSNVGTGMIVKLIENDLVLDQKVIVVLGDTDGNGDINAIDALKVVNHIIENELLIGPYKVAADTTIDNDINAIDALKIVNHIIGNILLN